MTPCRAVTLGYSWAVVRYVVHGQRTAVCLCVEFVVHGASGASRRAHRGQYEKLLGGSCVVTCGTVVEAIASFRVSISSLIVPYLDPQSMRHSSLFSGSFWRFLAIVLHVFGVQVWAYLIIPIRYFIWAGHIATISPVFQ